MAVLLSTGVRAAEACSLKPEHLHLENPDDAYIVAVQGKGGKTREVGLAHAAVRYLRRQLRLRASYAQVGVTPCSSDRKANQ